MKSAEISERVVTKILDAAKQKGLFVFGDKEALNITNLYEILPKYIADKVGFINTTAPLVISPIIIEPNGDKIESNFVGYFHESLSGNFALMHRTNDSELVNALGLMFAKVIMLGLVTQDQINKLQMDHHYGDRD